MTGSAETVRKDMGITHAEFHRILPGLFHDAEVDIHDTMVIARWPGRWLRIRLAAEQRRRFAMLSLPSTEVSIEFHGFTADQRAVFLGHFDRRFQRGGG